MDLVQRVLAGETRAIARMMSRAEAATPADRKALTEIYRHTGRAHVVGLTGVPGSGKSTMVRALAKLIRAEGRTVGIVAIDPSSPFSGGAILGDRIRMSDLSGDPGVFIRSMATGGALGGLARPAMDTVDILDAAGFDVVLIETVGVGQDEVDIVRAAHTVVVLSAPGLGDEIQAIKAGVLEIADIHAVSKCDRPDGARTVADLQSMLSLGRAGKPNQGGAGHEWKVSVIATSAEQGDGVEDLLGEINAHHAHLTDSGEMAVRRRQILTLRILKTAEDIVRHRLANQQQSRLEDMVSQTAAGKTDPYSAAELLLAGISLDPET